MKPDRTSHTSAIHLFARWPRVTACFVPRHHARPQRHHELTAASALRLCRVLNSHPAVRPGRLISYPDGWGWIATR